MSGILIPDGVDCRLTFRDCTLETSDGTVVWIDNVTAFDPCDELQEISCTLQATPAPQVSMNAANTPVAPQRGVNAERTEDE